MKRNPGLALCAPSAIAKTSFRALGSFAMMVLLAGCASFDGRGLVPGKSTAAEAEALMGPPAQRLVLASGETALYFSRLPEGRAVFMLTVDANGVMKSMEQRLVRSNLAKLAVGVTTTREVRELFGPPGSSGRLSRQARQWWEYKYLDYEDRRVFWVQFSDDGVVREVIDMRDWEWYQQNEPFGSLL